MKNLIFSFFLFVLMGCDGTNEPNATNTCLNPVNITGVEGEVANGYIVMFEQDIDIDIISVTFLEKYPDLEIYNTYQSINAFYGDSDSETLEKIQCELGVKSIEFNSVSTIN